MRDGCVIGLEELPFSYFLGRECFIVILAGTALFVVIFFLGLFLGYFIDRMEFGFLISLRSN